MGSFIPKPGVLDNPEVSRKAIERREVVFALRKECQLTTDHLERSMGMYQFSLAEGICLSGIGFGQCMDRGDLQTTFWSNRREAKEAEEKPSSP